MPRPAAARTGDERVDVFDRILVVGNEAAHGGCHSGSVGERVVLAARSSVLVLGAGHPA